MTDLDWLVIAVFCVVLLGTILLTYFKHNKSDKQFVAPLSYSWIILGPSLVATSVSTDTPLMVSGSFYENGLQGNWFWLATIPGAVAALFFFASLWFRSGVKTQIEVIKVRYGNGKKSRTFRRAYALYDAFFINTLVLTLIATSSTIILDSLFNGAAPEQYSVLSMQLSIGELITVCLFLVIAIYTMLTGFHGVLKTDLIQLILIFSVTIFVAISCVTHGIDSYGSYQALLDNLPKQAQDFALLPSFGWEIALLMLFGWWNSAPGSGMFVQRLIAAKDQKNALQSALFFIFFHYVFRAWPWFLIGWLALIYFPNLAEPEQSFVLMVQDFVPVGGMGVLVISLFAALMSTVDSRLNWAATYVSNDILPQASHKRLVESMAILLIVVATLVLTLSPFGQSLASIYKYLLVVQAGAAFAAIARWYWWRMSLNAEIVAIVSSFVIGNICAMYFGLATLSGFTLSIVVATVSCALLTGLYALCFSTSPNQHTIEFWQKTNAGGWGWRRCGKEHNSKLSVKLKCWLIVTTLAYSLIGLIGAMISLSLPFTLIYAFIFIILSVLLYKNKDNMTQSLGLKTKQG